MFDSIYICISPEAEQVETLEQVASYSTGPPLLLLFAAGTPKWPLEAHCMHCHMAYDCSRIMFHCHNKPDRIGLLVLSTSQKQTKLRQAKRK